MITSGERGNAGLNASEEVGRGDLKSLRQLEDRVQRWALLTALEEANISTVVAAFEAKLFLRKATFLSNFLKNLAEYSLRSHGCSAIRESLR
jgi:hypothetical protein